MFGLLGEPNELPIILFLGLDENPPKSILNSHQQDESMLHRT
jgi:hypothetical protein